MAKEHPNNARGEWVDDGRGQDRLNTGRPAQIQGQRDDGTRQRPGDAAADFYERNPPDAQGNQGGGWLSRLFGR